MDNTMTFEQQMAQLKHLGNRRNVMENEETLNPDAWQDLSEQYAAIGAMSNAARCTSRAAYYRSKKWIKLENA